MNTLAMSVLGEGLDIQWSSFPNNTVTKCLLTVQSHSVWEVGSNLDGVAVYHSMDWTFQQSCSLPVTQTDWRWWHDMVNEFVGGN